ncbi:MAG: alpha-2-macroglobulin family protein [Candidatus Rifleibacteriota bacterium]
MKNFLKPLCLFFALTMLLCSASYAETRSELWKKVQQAKSKGLPKTAIEHLDPIYEMAIKEGDMTDAVKALCEKIVLEGNIQGNKPEEKIVRLEEAIAKADPKVQPLLKIILAKWYWQYYSRNRYRFINRSRTEGLNEKDFTTWDLPKLFAYIGDLYENVLAQEDFLKKEKLEQLKGFLEFGNQPIELRPTLFDFFAHEALYFYMADDQSSAKPARAFEVEIDSPAMGSLKDFLAWQPEAFDKDSCNYRAIKLFQRLLKHCQDTDNLDSMLDNDLLRLSWVRRVAVGDEIVEKYMKRLEEFAKSYSNSPYSATAIGYIAQELYNQKRYPEALAKAEEGIEKWPNSFGAAICQNVKDQVLTRSLAVETEKVMLPKGSKFKVSFRNIDKAYFRLYTRDEDSLFLKDSYSPDDIRWDSYSKIFSGNYSAEWSADLEPGKDYTTQEAWVNLPDVAPGLYYLAASVRSDFKENKNCLLITPIIVSKLGMTLRKRNGQTEVFVVNNVSGEPMEGIRVKGFTHEYNKGWRQYISGSTDKDGKVSFNSKEGSGFFIAEHKGHTIYRSYDFYAYDNNPYSSGTQVYFFTDRSIYRPGQTVYFKGIVVSYNTATNEYKTNKGVKISVSFRDPNYQEVTNQSFMTNEFGSFNGSFIAPSDRLTGSYTIQARTFGGQTRIQIEEYKRPKFKVEIDTPNQSFQLDKEVKLSGKALAYTGAKIDGAQVKYRVVREVRFPPWCWWFRDTGQAQEIAHGSTTTDKNGEFVIRFNALPDRSVDKETQPIFHYTVTADVTDNTGETRSDAQVVKVGYTALSLGIKAPAQTEANTSFNVLLTTQTLDGKGVPGAGSFLVYELKQPERAHRKPYSNSLLARKTDKSNIQTWEEGKVVYEKSFNTTIDGNFSDQLKLPEGAYRIIATSRDRYNNTVKSIHNFSVIDYKSKTFSLKIPFFFHVTSTNLQPGSVFKAFWATGYDRGPAYIEVEHRKKLLKAFWTNNKENKAEIEIPVTEDMRGGFHVRVMQIKENREYYHTQFIPVEWTNKKLNLKFAHMTSKLQPGQKDTWKIQITGEEAEAGAIEMLAAMYDASLDAFAPHSWMNSFPVFYQDANFVHPVFTNYSANLYCWKNNLNSYHGIPGRSYPQLPWNVQNDFMAYEFGLRVKSKSMRFSGAPMPTSAPTEENFDGVALSEAAPMMQKADMENLMPQKREAKAREDLAPSGGGAAPAPAPMAPQPDLDKVTARSNLNETAFFYPNLITDDDGTVSIEFTIPEALTTWKFLGFAHGSKCQAGGIVGETVTQKDLMVQPNPPRFLREGDKIRFTAKVTNMSDTEQKGKIRLTLQDPVNDKNRNADFKLKENVFEFSVPAGESKGFGWTLDVPYTPGMVKYTVVGATNSLADGEEGMLPILSSRIFVTESMPLPIKGKEKKKFTFKKLLESKKSDTLENQGLTVEVTSNPAWYAVQALPYLIEFPHECSEQIFNRIYANQIAAFIANSDPKIKKVFDAWKADEAQGGKALYSNLEKNEHLKSVALLETPWVLDAKNETEQKHKIGVLFDTNRIEHEMNAAKKKLENYQLSDGGFPWFPGGRPNSFITLYIMTGFGRMRHLGVDVNVDMALKSLNYLDRWIVEVYQDILRVPDYEKRCNISPTVALYLYGRSFFLKEKPIPADSRAAVDFFLDEAREKWLRVDSRLAQGHIALALKRFGDKKVPNDIVNSIRERSVTDEELGTFWRENELSYWWYRAEIETQAVMIELFSEVADDKEMVDNCKIWLLKQKQTQNWKTTKATADAVYALLLRGADLLASDKLVEVYLDGVQVKPEKVEAGTGYYEKIYSGPEVKPEMGNIELVKKDEGIAWGAVHWQYLEDMSKITPHETNLKLKKTLFVKENTDNGPTIRPVRGNLKVGDLITVRIELRTDRDMEYIHMKDQRGSGMEPINVISRYKYQDGLAYYEATKDTATHFYIDYLPKGVYVFEYDLRVQHQGVYQSGMAEIQCMYAPEFNSHSESFVLKVTE